MGHQPQSCRWDLNPGPRPYQGRALPTEPRQRVSNRSFKTTSEPVVLPRVISSFRIVSQPVRRPSNPASRLPVPRQTAIRAGDGNRTHVACLEGRYSTIELHPPGPPLRRAAALWVGSSWQHRIPRFGGVALGVSGCLVSATPLESLTSILVRDPRLSTDGLARETQAEAVGGAGFEPAKAMPPDLQSGPFNHLGIHPCFWA